MSEQEFKDFKEQLKVIFTGYRHVTPAMVRKLNDLGFVLVRQQNHCIFEYRLNGKRYLFEVDKTPGDFRSGYKTVRDITRVIRRDLDFTRE